MTQQWFMENGYAIVNNSETMLVEIYYDDILLHSEEIYYKFGMHKIASDPTIKDFYEHFYSVCLLHKRDLIILSILNDSDIGYECE